MQSASRALGDPAVIEVTANPDGRLWIDRLGERRSDAGKRVHLGETERIIRLVASHVRAEVHADNPIVSAELPSCRWWARRGFRRLDPDVIAGITP